MVSSKTINVVRQAKHFYEDKLQSKLEATNMNDFVAIEPDSGDYFLGKSMSQVIQASRSAHPDRLAFAMRVGHAVAVDIGGLTS